MNGPPILIDMADYEKGHTALHKAAAYKRRTICCMLGNKKPIVLLHDLFYFPALKLYFLYFSDCRRQPYYRGFFR